MKLRQKLVTLMAASVVVTSVPVVTMAETTNTISVYNYNIKDTTIGFTTTSYVYGTTTEATACYTDGGVFSTSANVPKLEIAPKYGYNVTSVQSAFLYLTKDSKFVAEAYATYVDALNNGGTSTMYFDAAGKAVGAQDATWNGKTATQIVNLTDVSTGAGLVIGFDATGNVVPAAGASACIALKPMTSTKFTYGERTYESTVRMDLAGSFQKGNTYAIPFLAKVSGSDEVLAYLDGTDSIISTQTFALTGKLTDKSLVATSGSKTVTVDNIEEIGEIRLDENQIASLANADNRWIKVKLPTSSGLQFNLSKTEDNIKATGKRGFYNQTAKFTGTTDATKVDVKYGTVSRNSTEEDEQVLLIELPKFTDASAKGQVVLTGIYVEPTEKTVATGDVSVTVSEDLTRGGSTTTYASTKLVDSTSLKVATVADYDITLSCEPVKVKAGRSGVINETLTTFTLKEAVKDTLVSNRKIEFTLENGYMFGPADVVTGGSYTTAEYKALAKARFEQLIDDEAIKFEKDAAAKDDFDGFELTDIEIDSNGYVIGFTGYFDRLDETKANELKITIPVAAAVQSKGEIKVKASNLFTRTYEEDMECVVANIVEPISVEVENAAIKVGLQNQQAGKVTIKETDKGMIERGWLYLSAEDFEDGITFDEVPTVKVTSGNMEIKNVQLDRTNKVVALEVTKTSTEAATIEISDIKFTADRTVPEANYDLQIWGDALTDENVLDVISVGQNAFTISDRSQYTDMYIVDDFITMTTKNTQDINAEGLKAATASFVIGENKFTVNGETVQMDSAAYIKDNYTMVPVKYVAKAFGIEGNAIQYDQATSTATIIAGSKAISITAGKAAIIVNGTQVPMATKAEVVDGRMCVPMAYIASALNVQKSWDATTKTATFTNQAE